MTSHEWAITISTVLSTLAILMSLIVILESKR